MKEGIGKRKGIVANGDESLGVNFYHSIQRFFDSLVEDGLYDGQNEYFLIFLSLGKLLKNVENIFIYLPALLGMIAG